MRIANIDSKPEIEHIACNELEKVSGKSWVEYFEGVPEFRCSDPLWENLYRYRWYLIRQNLKTGGDPNQPYDGICEGPEIFHQPISYSTPPIIFDARWFRNPSLARNQLLNFCEMQEESGRIPGALHHDRFRDEMFYHADWGRALLRLEEVHPDDSFLSKIYPAFARYGNWLLAERDPENSGLIDIVNHMESGQEFSSRYLPANPHFDDEGWNEPFRLKGVDATVYALFLWEALGDIAHTLDNEVESKRWKSLAQRTKSALRSQMWDNHTGMYFDVVPGAHAKRSAVKTFTNFYPYLAGLLSTDSLPCLQKYLLSPDEFWTPVPVATLSRAETHFDADARWMGRTRNCAWNGRVWPMTNSHAVEILANAAELNPAFRKQTARLLTSFAHLFAPEGNPSLLSSYEHYNPTDGSPSKYRGIDDYLHCWMIDLIVRYVIGFRPAQGEMVIDPFPLGIDEMSIIHLPYRGSTYDIHIEGGRITLSKDGEKVADEKTPLRLRTEK